MNNLKYISLLLIAAFLSTTFIGSALGQESITDQKPIQNILIIGNKFTDDNVILRELLVKKGSVPSKEQLQRSRERLLNLYIFHRVELYLVPQDERGTILIIEVTEQIYFYPVPILRINERDWGKVSYGLSVIHYNFRGQNEKLWAGLWFGYRPGFGFVYSDPWAADSLHLTTGLSASKTTFNHHTLDFEERHVFGKISVGKWWNFQFKTELSLQYDRVSVDDPYVNLMHTTKSVEQLWGIEAFIRHDTRDLYSYPAKGWYHRLVLYKNGIFQTHNNYYKIDHEIRHYLHFGKVILAGRFYHSYLFGEIPVYRLNYIGFDERVRGHFYDVLEGRHINMGSLEVRFPIIPIRYFSLNLPPIPTQYLRNLQLGLSGGFFIDSGIIWNKGQEYAWDQFKTGYGFGLHLHLPYVQVLRFDYAFNSNFKGQFIFEVGVAF